VEFIKLNQISLSALKLRAQREELAIHNSNSIIGIPRGILREFQRNWENRAVPAGTSTIPVY
jgi:hypothetical protein